MTDLDKLIQESKDAVTAYQSYDDSEEMELRARATYARRQVFLQVLRELLADPDLSISELAEKLETDPQSIPMIMGQAVTDWIRERHWRETS